MIFEQKRSFPIFCFLGNSVYQIALSHYNFENFAGKVKKDGHAKFRKNIITKIENYDDVPKSHNPEI